MPQLKLSLRCMTYICMSLPSSISITQQLTPQLQQGLKGQELARLSKQLAAGGPSPRDSQSNLCNITDATV